jgi:signal transduction histidine kinase
VDIKLERLGQEVHLEVRDWGRGFEASETTNGGGPGERVGLPGMQERVSLLGGKLEIESHPGAGTLVAARVWLPEEEVVHGH